MQGTVYILIEGYRMEHCSCTVPNINLPSDKTSQTDKSGAYSGCFMMKKKVVSIQMYENKFRTKHYNQSITVGCEVMIQEYLGVLNQLQNPVTKKFHKTRTNSDNMPSNRPNKPMYHRARVIKIISKDLVEIQSNSKLKIWQSYSIID